MLTTLSLAAVLTACAWTDPGRDPYVGSVAQALARYSMPASTRAELSAMIRAGTPTDTAVLTRDSMTGQRGSYALTDMHFGAGRVCGTMDRSAWSATYSIDRVPVYCASGECVAIPSICGNVSRAALIEPPLIRRLPLGQLTTPDEIPGGTGLAEQTLPVDQALPAESFSARSAALEMPSARATEAPGAAPGATTGGGGAVAFGGFGGSLAGAPLLSVLPPLQSVAIGAADSVVLPIAEPAIWALLLAGILMMAMKLGGSNSDR